MNIPLSAPDIDEADIAAVVAVLRSGRLSLGPAAETFEDEFAAYLKVPYAVAVSSGTAGLHLALLGLGVGVGDEVIVPSFTFIAAANAIRYVGAIPVFVDIDPVTLNMDPALVARAISPKTRALMVVHTFGVPAQMDALISLANRHNLKVVEDACEAMGADFEGQPVGTFGDAGVFAFYPNKQMTTGEGGMIVTRSQTLAANTRSMRNQGRSGDDWFNHDLLGYNYRLSELHAALGVSQLRRLKSILLARTRVAALYAEALGVSDDFTLPLASAPRGHISWFVYVIRLSENFTPQQRDSIIKAMADEDIACGRYFAPVHHQKCYGPLTEVGTHLPVTDFVSQRSIALPFFNKLSVEQVSRIATCLKRAIAAAKGY